MNISEKRKRLGVKAWTLGVAGVAVLIAGVVYAQANFIIAKKDVQCGSSEEILKILADSNVNEKPIRSGENEHGKSEVFVFINFDTGAFTVVELGKDVGCVLGLGNSSRFFEPPRKSTPL